MSWQAIVVVLSVVAALVAMAKSYLAPELAMSAALGVFVVTGIVEIPDALQGFSSTSVHTVALLFVVSEAIRRSGLLSQVSGPLLGKPCGYAQAQLRLMIPTAALSVVLNNTPVVALFLPVVRDWGRRHGLAPSRLLIPLSYAAILGGTCTLIGTSTNLVVRGLLPKEIQQDFGMFTIGAVGVPSALLGLALIGLLGRKLLPKRPNEDEIFSDPRTFTTELIVEANGPLVGKCLSDIRVGDAALLTPVEINRGGTVLAAPALADTILQADDRLVLAGVAAAAVAIHGIKGLIPAADRVFTSAFDGRRRIFELIISPQCPLAGRKVGDGSFRARYNAAVLAVARHGEAVNPSGVSGWTLEVGDSVLVEAERGFAEQQQGVGDFIFVAGHTPIGPKAGWHPAAGLVILGAMLGLAGTEVLDPFTAALAAVGGALALRLLTWSQALAALQGRVLLTIAAALGVGHAIQSTGVATNAAGWAVELGAGSPLVTLVVVYFATAALTEIVTNNAAAAIMVPLALAASQRLGVNPMPFVVSVAVAASASFITPIGYQTNLMVYGPGGYRFSDFARVGVPVSLLVAAVTITLAPFWWPF